MPGSSCNALPVSPTWTCPIRSSSSAVAASSACSGVAVVRHALSGRRRAHARHRPGSARVRRARLRRCPSVRVGARRGAALPAGHAHPLPAGELSAGFRSVAGASDGGGRVCELAASAVSLTSGRVTEPYAPGQMVALGGEQGAGDRSSSVPQRSARRRTIVCRGGHKSRWPSWLALVALVPVLAACGGHRSVVARYHLAGDGVGSATFGQPIGRVIARLASGLGHPVLYGVRQVGGSTQGVVPLHCGYDQVEWDLIRIVDRERFDQFLDVYFRWSRFLGYTFEAPAGGPSALTTARRLGIGTTFREAHDLYRLTFRATEVATPGGKLVPGWRLPLPAGAVSGMALQILPAPPPALRTIADIQAGALPGGTCEFAA